MPVDASAPRPRWSVMIPVYNCAHYLRETLASVLAQDPGPAVMQIEVVDDCSPADDPEAVVRELGGGRVGFFRQPRRVGHTRNFHTCLQRSRGWLVHLLHGDDCVRRGFYESAARAFDTRAEIGAFACRHLFIDEDSHWLRISDLERRTAGILENWLSKIATGQRLQTPCVAVRREVYERLGGFDDRLSWAEDWEMWVRIAAHYPVWYEPEPLAMYRTHSASSSSRSFRSGENLADLRRAMEMVREHLPAAVAPVLAARAREHYAQEALNTAGHLFARGDSAAAVIHLREALRLSRSPEVLWRFAKMAVRESARKAHALARRRMEPGA